MHNSLPRVLFITTLDVEFDAVLKHLKEGQWHTRYYFGNYQSHWQVIVRQLHQMGNIESARETDKAIKQFSPQYVFLIGVAGGIKDVNLGDVVVATRATEYESSKVEEGVMRPRPNVEHSSYQLVEIAHEVAERCRATSSKYRVWVRPIASGEKVIKSLDFLRQLQYNCSDAVAVEMEAIGFLNTLRIKRHEGIVIRGISDLIANKKEADEAGWQPEAAHRAADFAFRMLEKLAVEGDLEEFALNGSIFPSEMWKHWSKSLTWCVLTSFLGLLHVWSVLAIILTEVYPFKELFVDAALLSFSTAIVSSLGIDYYFAQKEVLPLGIHFNKIVAFIRKAVFSALPFTIIVLSVLLFITLTFNPDLIKMEGISALEWGLISATLVYAFFVKLVILPEYRGNRQ